MARVYKWLSLGAPPTQDQLAKQLREHRRLDSPSVWWLPRLWVSHALKGRMLLLPHPTVQKSSLRQRHQWLCEQVTQRNCGCSIIGSVQSQVGWGFGQPDLVDDLAGRYLFSQKNAKARYFTVFQWNRVFLWLCLSDSAIASKCYSRNCWGDDHFALRGSCYSGALPFLSFGKLSCLLCKWRLFCTSTLRFL